MQTIKAATIQMVSSTRPSDNIATMQRLVAEAAAQGAQWVLLPEYWPIMGVSDTDKIAHAEPFGSGVLQQALSDTARRHQITLFGGTVPLQSDNPDKVLNTLLVYDSEGNCRARYDKMHLFGYSGLGEHYSEADTIQPGGTVPHFEMNGWGIAQGVCYDLRFPEFFRAQSPFDVLMLPAAFTYNTGKAHWELLLRTRAVENQCYVIASGQGGTHESGRRTYGHSMIIDPWGDILAVLPEGEGVLLAELNPARLASVRSRLPALQHRLL
ncbi:MAG: carbon-nitrogen hydrolase family protein [Neisseria sp.]|uniref:carbon-nitrogen hydrolase family protein n=1 Tax=Neisseria sp. TaxID=192066 RepID=UPI0026DB9002|nr:carbon-nitrogen hydrolase family protein [Neisseria sp.]MDO4248750.1 carbon-nitrogen hydrolase family protein [Neisseria sp.]